MSKVIVDVEQNSSIYSLDNIMFHLLETYGRELPKNIREEFNKLIDMLDDEVYKNIPSGDIIKTTLYERMTIENYDNKSDSDTKD